MTELSPIKRLSLASPLVSPNVSPEGKTTTTPRSGVIPRINLLAQLSCPPPERPMAISLQQDPVIEALRACNFQKLESALNGMIKKEIAAHLKEKLATLPEESTVQKRVKRIISCFEGLQNDLDEKKKLSVLASLKISLFVEMKLESTPIQAAYISKETEDLKRDLIIHARQFYVLSGTKSTFKRSGAERIVTNATRFLFTDTDSVQSKKLVAIVNNTTKCGYDEAPKIVASMKRQAELAKLLNGDIHQVVPFKSKKYVQLVVIEDKYEKNLKEAKLSPEEFANVVKQVALKLKWMHDHGYVHGDVKEDNILLDPTVKLTDFGFTYNCADFPFPKELRASYGTAAYSAPEFQRKKSCERTVDEGKKCDGYALGCVIYKFLCGGKEFPWELEFLWGKEEVRRLEAYQALIKQAESCVDERKALFDICVGLLHPDPQARMNIDDLLKQLG